MVKKRHTGAKLILIPEEAMEQILHGSATTPYAIRAAIQRSMAPLKELAEQHGLNQKTVAKWLKRTFVHNAPMGPKSALDRAC